MQFELTTTIIDEILFAMEDQDGEALLDTQEGIVSGPEDDEFLDEEDDDDDSGRFISLPDWDSSDGFRLMEHFTAGLRNPLIREELSRALNRGRGVFRAFKDAIGQHPETEKLWFNYKDREMKREIIRWYNGLREEWGLELIGEEPEDTAGLVLEDFRFRDGAAGDREAAAELHRLCDTDGGPDSGGVFSAMNDWAFPGDLCFVAETSEGEFAAYISAVHAAGGRMPTSGHLHICALEVSPEYRGLGLGESLLGRLLEKADKGQAPLISIDLPAGAEYFSRALLRESFEPCVQRYCRKRQSHTEGRVQKISEE